MKKSILKIAILGFFALISSMSVFAQPPMPPRAERLLEIKKERMTDVLDLDDEKAEKLFAKLEPIEKKMAEKMQELMKSFKSLRKAVKKNDKDADIKAKTDKIIKIQEEMFALNTEKQKIAKSILNDVEFAKFLLFEAVFQEKAKEAIMKHRGGDDRGPRDGRGQGRGKFPLDDPED